MGTRIGPNRGALGLAAPLCFLLLSSFSPSSDLLVGHARALSPYDEALPPNWERLDAVSNFSRSVCVSERDTRKLGKEIVAKATARLGPLSPLDRYWLGTSWWVFHQPPEHIHFPAWAPRAVLEPEIALYHPEGGNCESSANFQSALLTAMGVPSRAVYGDYLPTGEGHVWVLSDVGGSPMLSDAHVARASEEDRESPAAWRPDPTLVQISPSGSGLIDFLRKHQPDEKALSGLRYP